MCAVRTYAMAVASNLGSQSILRRTIQAFAAAPPWVSVINYNKLSHSSSLHSVPLSPLSFPSVGLCQLAQATQDGIGRLLRVGDKNASEEVKHILEMARRASSRREVLHTDFLTPPILKESVLILEKLADVKTVAQGGYPQAERCRLSVGHPEVLTADPDIVAAMSISGNFGFQPCSHGDFLGAILGVGIAREKLGDIILQGEKGAHILIIPELVDFVMTSLDKVGNVSVVCKKIPLLALEYEPPRTKTFRTVEASLRVDAVASAGFKISRTKLGDLISNGDLRINWATVTKSNTTIKSGDIISISGKGRLKIGEINSTKKGADLVEREERNLIRGMLEKMSFQNLQTMFLPLQED